MNIWLITVAILLWRAGVGGDEIASVPQFDQSLVGTSTFWITNSCLSQHCDQLVSESEVSECDILGTKITGHSRCTGRMVSSISGDDGYADMRFALKGVIESENIGVNGPVKIYSKASTAFAALKIVRFDGVRLITWPVELETKTEMTITNVDTHLKGIKAVIVKRIASARAQETSDEVRVIAEGMTKERLGEKIDEEFDRQLSLVNVWIHLCRGPITLMGKRDIHVATRHIEGQWEVGIVFAAIEK